MKPRLGAYLLIQWATLSVKPRPVTRDPYFIPSTATYCSQPSKYTIFTRLAKPEKGRLVWLTKTTDARSRGP